MWYTNKNEACAAASSSQQVWNAAQEKSESGRVDFLELEQAKQRVEELRTIIEKNNRLYYDQNVLECKTQLAFPLHHQLHDQLYYQLF